MRKIEDRVSQQDHQLLMFAQKSSGKWIVRCLDYNTFPRPLPKLFLRGPKLLPVRANHQRSLLLSVFLFLALCAHPLARSFRTDSGLCLHGRCFARWQRRSRREALNGETSFARRRQVVKHYKRGHALVLDMTDARAATLITAKSAQRVVSPHT